MSTSTVREIVGRKRKEYRKARKGEKKRILDEVEGLTGIPEPILDRIRPWHANAQFASKLPTRKNQQFLLATSRGNSAG